MIHIPRPSLMSTLCLVALLGGYVLTACAMFDEQTRLARANDLIQVGNVGGAVAMAVGGPAGIFAGGALIAGAHAAAGLIRHNRPGATPERRARRVTK